MKFISALASFLILSCVAEAKPIALVYNGKGACVDGDCAQAAANMAERAGFKVKFISEKDITPEIFYSAEIWVQPGGNAIELSQAIKPHQQEAIKHFISNGGSYLGFCAGGFFADKEVDPGIKGLGLLKGETFDYSPIKTGMVVLTLWMNQFRYMYVEEAPHFSPIGPNEIPLAYYANGQVAAMQTTYGKGRVVVTGPHPEAPPEWPEAFNAIDPDGSDFDLAVELFSKLIPK